MAMKRINCIRLVGLTILVLAVGQIGAMDQTLNKELVKLQQCIDTGDLNQVRQQVEKKNLKGHLNDQYICKSILVNGTVNPPVVFEYMVEFNQPQVAVVSTGKSQFSSLSYALNKYRSAIVAPVRDLNVEKNYLAIVRYFLQEGRAAFNRFPTYARNQDFLVIATTHGDIEAVKLFIQYGMLQERRSWCADTEIDILAMVKAGVDYNGNQVSQEIKAAYVQMLPYFERPWFSFTAKNTVIAFVAAAIVALGVKKAYDWFSNSSDEQEEAEQAPDAASLAPDQADPVGA
jgi:hypothetical protein